MVAAALAGPMAGVAGATDARYEPETELLAVRLDGITLNDGLPCRVQGETVRVPFGALCSLLDLGIRVDAARGTATGFFLTEGRHFSLDLASRVVHIESRTVRFEPGRVEVADGDLYVDAALIGEWLPLTLEADPYAQVLAVVPRELLPMERRRERRMEVERNLEQLGVGGPAYPAHPTPYRLLGRPFLDQSLTLHAGRGGQPTGLLQAEGTTYATMSLLYAEVGAYVSNTGGDGPDVRVHVSRRSSDGEHIGPIEVRDATVGDVDFPGLDLIARPVSGPGLSLTNRPAEQPSQFDSHTFTGELPPGWSVELYRNGTLLGYQESDATGRYTFADVPLLFGPNRFRKMFYGPQGQQREESGTFNVGLDLTPPGTATYRIAASDLGNRFKQRSLVEGQIGLTRQLSVGLDVAGVQRDGAEQRYAMATARGFYGGLLASLDHAAAQGGGTLTRAGAQTRLGPLGVDVRQTQLDHFDSEVLGALGGTGRSTQVRLDAVPRLAAWLAFPFVVDYTRSALAPGRQVDQLGTTLGWSHHGISVTSHNQWTRTLDPQSQPVVESHGELYLGRQSGHVGVRGQVDYAMRPAPQVSTLALSTDLRLPGGARLGAGINHTAGQDRVQLALERGSGPFGYGVHASYDAHAGVTASLALSAGLASEPITGRWYASARPVANYGAAAARVFLDANGNGRYDPGEPLLEDVGVRVDPPSAIVRTSAAGVAFVDHLPTTAATNLVVSTATLQNPAWVPERPGVRLTPRAGVTTQVDFPVLQAGEVNGTVHFASGPRPGGIGGIEIALRDVVTDSVVRRQLTDYDGYYDFAELRPGNYVLDFSRERARRPELQFPPAYAIQIDASGAVRDGLDFALTAAPEPQVAVEGGLPAETTTVAAPVPALVLPGPARSAARGPVLGPQAPAPVATWIDITNPRLPEESLISKVALGPDLPEPPAARVATAGPQSVSEASMSPLPALGPILPPAPVRRGAPHHRGR